MSELLAGGQSVPTLAGGPSKNDLKVGNWAAASSPAKPLHRLPLRLPRHHHRRRCSAITTTTSSCISWARALPGHLADAGLHPGRQPHDRRLPGHPPDLRLHEPLRIRGNTILVNDGYDIDKIVAGVVTTHIPHSLVVGNRVRIRTAKPADGKTMPDKDVFITSVPTRSSFTYSLTAAGKNETDTATGGFVQALDYQGCMCPARRPSPSAAAATASPTRRPTSSSTATSSSPTAPTTPPRALQRHRRLGPQERLGDKQHHLRQRKPRGPCHRLAQRLHLQRDLPDQLSPRRHATGAPRRRTQAHPRRIG